MTKILHLIEGLSFGGAARGVFAAAKFSKRANGHEHVFMPISLAKSDLSAKSLADESGVRLVLTNERSAMLAEIESADIVQLNWWNSPNMDAFLRSGLPAMRLAGWLHVGGHTSPQVVVPELLEFLDAIVPTSPYAMQAPAICGLTESVKKQKVTLAYGPADFSRLDGLQKIPHAGFNIGYIGTISFQKMHRDFTAMSSAVQIPDVKFILCGSGGAELAIISQAKTLSTSDRFEMRGYVQDIKPVLATLDAYGYPLCEETYASSELNLQEVMYAGIPVVVFPSGGVRHLVINDVTGFVVNSAREYKEALEYLYHNPEERLRIGAAAHQYASKIFGAQNAAVKLNLVYDNLLRNPKKQRRWGNDIAPGPAEGATAFTANLGFTREGNDFHQSFTGKDLEKILAAEYRIAHSTELMRMGGVLMYRAYYPNDAYLWFWSGLISMQLGESRSAASEFFKSAQLGFEHWRVLWYLSLAAEKIGEQRLANECVQAVERAAPGFTTNFAAR